MKAKRTDAASRYDELHARFGLSGPMEVNAPETPEKESPILRRLLKTDADPMFRAGADHHGDWYVWRKVSASGWATLRRCDTQADAEILARRLATGEGAGEFAG